MGFYELEEGNILIDGVNIKLMNVSQLRRIFGVVSQEPVLFRGTVSFNIKYNSEGNEDEIRVAARHERSLLYRGFPFKHMNSKKILKELLKFIYFIEK